MRYIPDAETALAETKELFVLASRYPDALVEIGRLAENGTPFLCAYVDKSTAEITGDVVARYQLPERLKILLATLRARDGKANKFEGGFDRHVEITPQMIEAGFQVLCNSGIADEYLKVDKCMVAEIYQAMSALGPHAEREFLSTPGQQTTKTSRQIVSRNLSC